MTDKNVSVPAVRSMQGMTHERWRKLTEWPLLVIAVVFLAGYSIQVIANLNDRQAAVLNVVIGVTWVLFGVDYLVQLILAPRRLRWFTRNLHQLLILALPMLRPLRLLRLVTVLSVVHRFAGATLRGRVLTYVLGSALILTYLGAIAVLDAEENVPGSNIRNIGDALWWAVVTITTVGYGDHYPITAIGRLVAVGLMIGGIAVLGVVTASVAAWLVEQVRTTTAKEVQGGDSSLEAQIAELTALLKAQSASTQGPPDAADHIGARA